MLNRKPPLSVLPVGTKVVVEGDIDGVISAICIRGNDFVSYEVIWWNNRSRVLEWVTEDEVSEMSGDKEMKIGFK